MDGLILWPTSEEVKIYHGICRKHAALMSTENNVKQSYKRKSVFEVLHWNYSWNIWKTAVLLLTICINRFSGQIKKLDRPQKNKESPAYRCRWPASIQPASLLHKCWNMDTYITLAFSNNPMCVNIRYQVVSLTSSCSLWAQRLQVCAALRSRHIGTPTPAHMCHPGIVRNVLLYQYII